MITWELKLMHKMKRSKHFKLRPVFIARPHKSVNERGQRTITLQSLPALYHPFPPFYEQIDELMASTSSKEFTGASSYLIQAIVGSFYFMMPKFCTIWVLNSRGFWGLPSSVSKLYRNICFDYLDMLRGKTISILF